MCMPRRPATMGWRSGTTSATPPTVRLSTPGGWPYAPAKRSPPQRPSRTARRPSGTPTSSAAPTPTPPHPKPGHTIRRGAATPTGGPSLVRIRLGSMGIHGRGIRHGGDAGLGLGGNRRYAPFRRPTTEGAAMPGPRRSVLVLLVAVTATLVLPTLAHAQTPEAKVSVAGPPTPYLPNAVNEPALAIDANHPTVLAAGANDLVDSAPCNGSSCDLTPDIGISGIYFSLNEGASWVQPTYTGLTALSGTLQVGPIHTLPWYFENGMSSHGDPALAFGPQPGPGGFSWANGSRLYYANLAFPIAGRAPFNGSSAVAVSRTDNAAAAAAGDKNAWMPPVVVTKQSAATFSDKEDIWADNAATSPHFGNVYVCNVAFRSIGGAPEPVVFSRSTDGGATWRQRQLSAATNNAQTGGRQGCAIRSDSTGVVYVVWEGADIHTRQSVFYLARSFDGGNNFERPRAIADVVDVGLPDPVSGRIVFDGYAGTRTDSFPSLGVANGAPTGAG